MTDINLGFTFSDTAGPTVSGHTASKTTLEEFISNAIVTNIGRLDFDVSTSKVIEVAAAVPTTVVGEEDVSRLWYDTTADEYKVQNDTGWDDVSLGSGGFNALGATIFQGTVLKMDTGTRQFTPVADDEFGRCVGVAASTVSIDAHLTAVKCGIHGVLIQGPVTPGDVLTTDATFTGAAVAATLNSSFANVTAGIMIGQALASVGSGVQTLSTCVLFL